MTIAEPRMDRMVASVAHVFDWLNGGDWERHHLDPGIADFTFGNPQELPLPGLVDRAPAPRRAQGQGLVRVQVQRGGAARDRGRVAPRADRHRLPRPEDVAMTAGAFGGLA